MRQSNSETIGFHSYGIFWDIENCSIPSNKRTNQVIQNIKLFIASNYESQVGHQSEPCAFYCSCDIRRLDTKHVDALNRSGVDILHVNSIPELEDTSTAITYKVAVNSKLKECIEKFVDHHYNAQKCLLFLITADIDFGHTIRSAKRKGFKVILIYGSNAFEGLISAATESHSYNDIVDSLQFIRSNEGTHSGDVISDVMSPQLETDVSDLTKHFNAFQASDLSKTLTRDVRTVYEWPPSQLAPTTDDSEEKKTQELLEKITIILNELTPEKYTNDCERTLLTDLLKETFSLEIVTEDRLKRVLDLVHEMAVDSEEPVDYYLYADICKHLSNEFKVIINKDHNSIGELSFHKLLIQKCQKEFETEIYASITDLKERQQEIENTSDPKKKKMLKEVLDEDMRRARKRSLRNIKLIGELYKLGMLKANIMVQCIDGLIKEADDESLECLCALFETIGEQIEAKAAENESRKTLISSFFIRMWKIAEQKDSNVKGISARIRFMLRDILNMRNNNWKPPRDKNYSKMVDEIPIKAQKTFEKSARDLRMGNESDNYQRTTVTARKSQSNASEPKINCVSSAQQQQSHETSQLGPQSRSGNESLGGRRCTQSQCTTNICQNYLWFKKDVEEMVRQKKSNDNIQDYISKYFNSSQTTDHKFTNALFTAVINGCIDAPTDTSNDQFSYSFENNTFQAVCPLLSKFLGGDTEREVQALIALQELMDELEHPSPLLPKIFRALYDSGIIAEEAFLQWKK